MRPSVRLGGACGRRFVGTALRLVVTRLGMDGYARTYAYSCVPLIILKLPLDTSDCFSIFHLLAHQLGDAGFDFRLSIIGTRKEIHVQTRNRVSRAFLAKFVENVCQEEYPHDPHSHM